jgi:hypothetical protein
MGDADAAAIRAARGDWVGEHLEIYLTSGGTRGHILDVSAVGGRALITHCLIKCVGRKYSRPRGGNQKARNAIWCGPIWLTCTRRTSPISNRLAVRSRW